MSGLVIALPCLALSGLLGWLLDKWLGGGPVKFHDLTRQGGNVENEWVPQVDQVTREPNNTLSVASYEKRRDALGLGAVREVRQ